MHYSLQVDSRRQSVTLRNKWDHVLFAHTNRGDKGWYSVLVPGRGGSKSRLLNAPRGRSDGKRPHAIFWTRAEVNRFFVRVCERINARFSILDAKAA